MAAVMRYVDNDNFARFRTENDETTYYEERTGGVWATAANVGPNRAGDNNWHHWKVVLDGENNTLYIDGRYVGCHKSSPALANQKDLRIGFSVRDTFASFDDIRVRNYCVPEPQTRIGNTVSTAEGKTP
jgi:hypothetical protein